MENMEGNISSQSRLYTDSADQALRLSVWMEEHQSNDFWLLLSIIFSYIYADCASVGPVIFNNILPRTAFYTWETANSQLIQQKREEHLY